MRSPLIASIMIVVLAQTALAQEQPRKLPAQQPIIAPVAAPGELLLPTPAPNNPAAAYEPGFSLGGDAIPALPLEVMKSGPVTYINGGIGDEELAQLKAQNAAYNVQIMLSAPGGAFISDIRLRLLDASGAPILDLPDAGPYLYASLPPGAYTLETTNPGEAPKTQSLKAPAKGAVKKHIVYNQ